MYIPFYNGILMSYVSILVERVFKFVGSVPHGDDVKKKDLLVSSLHKSCKWHSYENVNL